MTLDHVRAIEAGGRRVEDGSLVKMLPTVYRITLTLDDGSSLDFFHESAEPNDITRLREDICSHTLAYGGRALLQSIHTEVLERAKSQRKAPEDFIVSLSRDCYSQMQPYLPGYQGYGYTFRVAPDREGMWYSISSAGEQFTRNT